MTILPKKKSHAFGKDCYLLGRHKDDRGIIWLEASSWDCGWYWGFGHIETYTNQMNPSKAKDILSHSHFNSLVGHKEGGSYIYHLNEVLTDSTLTDNESWILSDLMKTAYALRETAEIYRRGGSNLSGGGKLDVLVDKEQLTKINEVQLPAIFDKIYQLLSPTTGE